MNGKNNRLDVSPLLLFIGIDVRWIDAETYTALIAVHRDMEPDGYVPAYVVATDRFIANNKRYMAYDHAVFRVNWCLNIMTHMYFIEGVEIQRCLMKH